MLYPRSYAQRKEKHTCKCMTFHSVNSLRKRDRRTYLIPHCCVENMYPRRFLRGDKGVINRHSLLEM